MCRGEIEEGGGGGFGRFASFEMLAGEPRSCRVHNSWNPSRPSGLHLNSTVEELWPGSTACSREWWEGGGGGEGKGVKRRRKRKSELTSAG